MPLRIYKGPKANEEHGNTDEDDVESSEESVGQEEEDFDNPVAIGRIQKEKQHRVQIQPE